MKIAILHLVNGPCPNNKYSGGECHRGCTCKTQAWFLPSSFHPRLPVTLTNDEFIIGFKRMHHASDKHTFSANTPKKHTRLDFKHLIDSTMTINR